MSRPERPKLHEVSEKALASAGNQPSQADAWYASELATTPLDVHPMTPEKTSLEHSVTSDSAVSAGADEHRGQLRMAERFARMHGPRFRYAHGLGWLVWDSARWRPDRDGAPQRGVIDVVKAAIREAADAPTEKCNELLDDVRRVESEQGLRGVLAIAANLKPLAVSVGDLDADPWLFNTTNGTVDLDTGELRPHDPDDLLTKVAPCAFDPHANGPEFAGFLATVLPDPEVRGFVQRVFGYAMLGVVREHVLPIFTGAGSNGKSTLLEAVSAAFGDYAIVADPDLLVDRGTAHPTGQADLQGIRLAVTHETDEGRPLASATVKRLTGGDKIRARRMRQDFFEFTPAHTIVMVTNHKPRVAGDDPALWRRIRVVPFGVVISEPDVKLPEKLAAELPGVLGWAYAGYRGYRERGLDAPETVTKSTESYRTSSDPVGRFLDERTTTAPSAVVYARVLYTAWSSWCQHYGEEPGSEVTFAEALGRRGVTKKRRSGGQVYPGVMLRAPESGSA